MREILFRAKDTKEIWHIGLLAHIGNAWYISNKAGISTAYEVIPSTIGQYIGITDKDGIKIFEGDIVKTKYGRAGVVKWFAPQLCFDISPIGTRNNINIQAPDLWDLWNSENLSVIGNIYDKPELLLECI